MEPNRHVVIVRWRDEETGAESCFSLHRRVLVLIVGAFLCLAGGAAVLGGVALRLHRENSALLTCLLDGEARLAELDADMAEAWEGFAQVRAEEAKIRQWLGLEPGHVSPAAEPPGTGGGQGSSGDVDLATVAPEELAVAAAVETAPVAGLGGTARSLASDLAELADRIQERKRYWDAIPTISPVDGEHWQSSGFGWRNSPFTGAREFHSGVDLAGERGTPVVAAAAGKVVRVVKDPALGRAVTLDHGNGLETIYGHLDRVLVREGQRLGRGQELGELGSTGRRSTGPHLHYAVRKDGKYVNPKNYLLDGEAAPYPIARQ
jgi:murein DD-endopeptidase MepM/ murein hydrolase activator NlpD